MIEILEYDREWPRIFREEALKIKEALGDNCITIHHIGSTSVHGLSAKPIIDILPVVVDLRAVDGRNFKMQELGYEVKGEYGFMLRRFFVKEKAFNVHVFEQNNPDIERHLKFRNWMRNNPVDRAAYAALKEKLATSYPNDMTSYCFAKDEFVADIDEKAGWHGIRVVKALTGNEWGILKKYRREYYEHLRQPDPYIDLLNDPTHFHLVVLKKTDIIGYAHIQLYTDSMAVLHFICINKDNQKKNFGSQLLIFIEKWLDCRNFNSLYSQRSPETLGFLKKHGFQKLLSNSMTDFGNEKYLAKIIG